MCGRITQIKEAAAFLAELGPEQQVLNFVEPGPIARYNITRTDKAKILYNVPGGLKLEGVKWGWKPSWAEGETAASHQRKI